MYCSTGWIEAEEIRDMIINSGGENIKIPDFCPPIPKYKYIVKFKDLYILIGDMFLGYSKEFKPKAMIWEMPSVEPIIRMCNK